MMGDLRDSGLPDHEMQLCWKFWKLGEGCEVLLGGGEGGRRIRCYDYAKALMVRLLQFRRVSNVDFVYKG